MQEPTIAVAEHTLDVLSVLSRWQEAGGDTALAVIRKTQGGAVRAVGALMAVHADGRSAGYVSGGCIDADLVLRARKAIERQASEIVVYGAGSPFVDLPLPCGGQIEIGIIARPDARVISAIITALAARQSIAVLYSDDGEILCSDALTGTKKGLQITYEPKLRIRIAGRGADCLALARVARTSGFEVDLFCIDGPDAVRAKQIGLEPTVLVSPRALPAVKDDAQTAFILMFHDGDWEIPLLQQALAGPAFYIGAVGSRHTHAKRRAALEAAGVSGPQRNRVRGPIGLVPSLRNASTLAISTLAEIIEVFQDRLPRLVGRTALVLLAAGASNRFQGGDKLFAALGSKRLIDYAMARRSEHNFGRTIAVTAHTNKACADYLTAAGWDVIVNPQAERGQSTSLKAAISAVKADPSITHILVMLADMPNIPEYHLDALLRAGLAGHSAILSKSETTLLPPALIARDRFDMLLSITGDIGARKALAMTGAITTVDLAPQHAVDVDTVEDLERVESLLNG